ncbi:MAG: ankyrin repeat domain-containing protein [Deltaproteobacteria bacterium]|nr:ankyrin repeat domain-containing protein [Deltaproteobacteria bacterium]
MRGLVAAVLAAGLCVGTACGPSNLHEAAKKGEVDAVAKFLARGGDINALSDDGLAPIHLAALGAHGEAARNSSTPAPIPKRRRGAV